VGDRIVIDLIMRIYVALTSRETDEPSLLGAILMVMACMGTAAISVELMQR
jgi:hypothetical protein